MGRRGEIAPPGFYIRVCAAPNRMAHCHHCIDPGVRPRLHIFHTTLDRYRSDGEGGLVRQTAECPAPFANVFMGSVPENANDELTCHLASRTLLLELHS